MAKWSDRSIWMSFDDTLQCVIEKRAAGIGIVLSPEDGYVGVDLDDCVEDGQVAPWAQQVVDRLSTYCERSPSGRGIHQVCRGEAGGRNMVLWIDGGGKVEVFGGAHYLRMTGDRVDGTPSTIEERQEALDEILAAGRPADSAPKEQGTFTEEGWRILEGNRDVAMASVSGSMRRRGWPWEAILEAIRPLNAWCVPPLTEEDLVRIARSIERYDPEDDDSPSAACPTLAASARLDPALGTDACPWLDEYIAWSRRWSPRAYDPYHETCGIFVLATVAARRVMSPVGLGLYTSIYSMLVGRSTVSPKTTTKDLAMRLLSAAGLTGLITPGDVTPEKMFENMSGYIHPDDDVAMSIKMTREKATRINALGEVIDEMRYDFVPQQGWVHDEFGRILRALSNERHYLSKYRDMLRMLYDCPQRHVVERVGRRRQVIDRPYLCILANTTPTDMRGMGRDLYSLLTDGFLARFAMACPPPDHPISVARFPDERFQVPDGLVRGLRAWHESLPQPSHEIVQREDSKGKLIGDPHVVVHPVEPRAIAVGKDVTDLFYNYGDALMQTLAGRSVPLDASIGRMANRALRVAALLASCSGATAIELRHWARAQEISERWREGAYNVLSHVRQSDVASQRELGERRQERILRAHYAADTVLSIFEVTGTWRDAREDIVAAYDILTQTGELVEVATNRTAKYGPPRLANQWGGDIGAALQDRVVEAHRQHGGRATRREITRHWRGVEADALDGAYEAAVEDGRLVATETGKTTEYEAPRGPLNDGNCLQQ
jgi:hypothetical protein